MAEQDQINNQGIYAVVEKVIRDLLPLDPYDRLRVYRTVGTFFGLEDLYPKIPGNVDGWAPISVSGVPRFSGREELTPKEFLLQKKPNTDVERVACLAYYLARYRDIHQFNIIDISKLNTEAAKTKLSNASYVVSDAARAGYLTAATKGTKQLSAQGEQYVEALPDRDAAKEVKPRTSKRSRGKASVNRVESDHGQEQVKPNE